jgi:two-component system response regulator YesN
MYQVLLVEDEIVVREGIRNSIPWEKTSYTLTGEAPDGEVALSMILDSKPDILITDIKMPFVDGLTLSRIVKKNLPLIKIIILSGHDEFEYAREAISIGVEEYLLKPVSAREMIKTLEKVAKRIDEEKEGLLGFESLRSQTRSPLVADGIMFPSNNGEKGGFDPTGLLNIDGDIFFTKLKYAAKKDIDSIVQEYFTMLGNSWGENPIMIYFLFGEIIVSASKIAEALGGDIKDIVPFSLSHDNIQALISSPDLFSKRVKALIAALIEFRDSHTAGRYQSVIVKAREYIDDNFTAPDLSLYSTAVHVGISPNHLSTVFAQETGENFIEYLTRVRIERAKLLLKSTAMKSADIAGESGFSDPHYFSFIFKKNTGLSPREFRLKEQSSTTSFQK